MEICFKHIEIIQMRADGGGSERLIVVEEIRNKLILGTQESTVQPPSSY